MEYLVISTIAPNDLITFNQLTSLTAKCECNIEDSRMKILGNEIAIIMLISGNWNTVAKLEGALAAFSKENGVELTLKRTKQTPLVPNTLPYVAQITGMNRPGIIHEISNFIIQQSVHIEDLQTNTYIAALSGSSLFVLNMRISIPADRSISEFREQFMLLVDDLNLDGILEPERR